MLSRHVRGALLIVTAALAAGCVEAPATRGHAGNIRLVREVTEAGGPRAIIATFVFTPDGIKPAGTAVVPGAGNDVVTEHNDYEVDLVDARGRVLGRYGIKDPRKAIIEGQGWFERPSAQHVARFPFSHDAAAVRVLDERGRVLAHADVAETVEAFCRARQTAAPC